MHLNKKGKQSQLAVQSRTLHRTLKYQHLYSSTPPSLTFLLRRRIQSLQEGGNLIFSIPRSSFHCCIGNPAIVFKVPSVRFECTEIAKNIFIGYIQSFNLTENIVSTQFYVAPSSFFQQPYRPVKYCIAMVLPTLLNHLTKKQTLRVWSLGGTIVL